MLKSRLMKLFIKPNIPSIHTYNLWNQRPQFVLVSQCVQNLTSHADNSGSKTFPGNGVNSTTDANSKTTDLPAPVLSLQLIHHLERTSLVDFDNKEALSRLSEAITFANQLFEVNTDGIEPLVTVLENESLHLRDDRPEACKRKEILSNASITEEDYFVAPPGNVPLEPSSKDFSRYDSER